uniref:Uncharacterized protein n=1 Tax=Rhizophora mucronata TaxID=61149 RepID=A0A2P2QYD4_RHIMU
MISILCCVNILKIIFEFDSACLMYNRDSSKIL